MSLPSPSSTAANPDTSRVHAFILAGGHGARLQGLTAVRAKPAVAFAG